MKLLTVLTLCCLMFNHAFAESITPQSKQVFVLEINGVIGPATADYFERSFDTANRADTAFILLKMDTPGGLDLAMRSIIKTILSSPVPIVTYVTPSGSRAASAGTYILYASHITAMSPGTNLGAATPIQMIPSTQRPENDPSATKENNQKNDNVMSTKIINDAVAYIKGLAALRGRNIEWAEQAVREGASLPAEEALKENVIDIVANNRSDLFKQLDQRKIRVLGQEVILTTSDIVITELLPDWRNKLLTIITDPNIAYILMLVGIYGLIFEFANPGIVLPGTVGAICLLLALFSFQVLPINYAGLALIILGIALMTAEAFQPSFGALGLGGIVAFASGSVILVDTDVPGYGIDIGIIAGFTVATASFFILALGLVFKARRHPVVSGEEQMIGIACVAIEDFDKRGRVQAHSEVWNAITSKPIRKGDAATVKAINGLVLEITPDN